MQTFKVKRNMFEKHKTNLNLTQIDENKYLYKKKLKYKLKKLLKVIGMIFWMPISIPVTLTLSIATNIIEYFTDLIHSVKDGDFKLYLTDINKELESILNCIIEVIE